MHCGSTLPRITDRIKLTKLKWIFKEYDGIKLYLLNEIKATSLHNIIK